MHIVPKVSVVIPAYNVCAYIEETLLSLERQTFAAFEAIIVNDGSTDETAAIAQSFCQRDARFRLITNPNGGLSAARNFGICHAKADYIAMLDGDDIYEPDKLANHVRWLDADPQIGVVYSASKTMREDGRVTWLSISGKPICSDPLVSLLCKNFVGHGSNAVFRRATIDEVGGFDETLRSSEDIDLWLRIAATGRWRFQREVQPLCCYRVRPSGLSFNISQMYHSHQKVLQAASDRSPSQVEPWLYTADAYMYRLLARIALTSGDVEQAQQFIERAWASDRSIFYRDPRSLLTLAAVKFSPLTKQLISRSLGSARFSGGDAPRTIQGQDL
jgi:glycosyltransferase involved in cell wall biosynthesis